MNITIRKISNGYISSRGGEETFSATLEELFEELLMIYECRSKNFGGDSFGVVFVARKPQQQFIAPAEQEPI